MSAISAGSQRRQLLVEDSVPLRVVTTAMALTGVVTAVQLTESPWYLALVSTIGCVLGSYLSYKRRYANNFIVKIWISVGILLVASWFFNELLLLIGANVADSRVPLTKLLMLLIALHCFDLPRRRDLSLSALVGLTLMTVASTLSRDLYFSWSISCFMVLAVCMFQLDCASRSLSRAKLWMPPTKIDRGARPLNAADVALGSVSVQSRSSFQRFRRDDIWRVAFCSVLVFVLSFACFALLPRSRINLQQLKFSGSLPYQMNLLAAHMPLGSSDGSIKPSPHAYNGFSEQLDTNYRGDLGDAVVLRVSCNFGTYLRGMAYDTFDGKIWYMSHPKQVTKRIAGAGNSFDLAVRFPHSKVKFKTISQEIFVEEDNSNLLFCASIPYQIYFPSSYLAIDTYGGIRSPGGLKKDMVYTVFSRIPLLEYAVLRKLPELTPEEKARIAVKLANFLQLPPQLSPELSPLAAKTAGKGSDFLRAERLCNFLQTHFKYDLNAAAASAGTDSVSDFLLHKRRGSCEHFASALVMMCRSQGIPAMLVTGYQPGIFNPFTGLWEVHLNDAHSWVEVYVRKYGWVPLDPTPNSVMGSQSYQEPQSVLAYLAQVLEPFWRKISENAIFLALGKTVQVGFISLSTTWLYLSPYFAQVLTVAIAAALLLSIAPLVRRLKSLGGFNFNFAFSKKSSSSPELNEFKQEATHELMAVSRSLKAIGVERQRSETAAEWQARVVGSLAISGMESSDFLASLGNFLELYSEMRFGSGSSSDLERLRLMGQALGRMTLELSKQRRTTVISK